jgi:hypothetical protein
MNNSNESKNIVYNYTFEYSNGEKHEFLIELDKKTLLLVPRKKQSYPAWTKLINFKCSNCPLNIEDHDYCPLAINLIDVLKVFKNDSSFEDVKLIVKTNDRKTIINTTFQDGISSLLGLYMTTSGCPVLGKLKPMVKFHTPVPTLDETIIKSISIYLLAQFFIKKHGKKPDWDLKNLVKIYQEIQIVNRCVIKKISSHIEKDASLNALVILNDFADFIPFSINLDELNEIEDVFSAYFN